MFDTQDKPAEAATDIGADDDDQRLPFLDVLGTFLLVVVVVSTVGLLAVLWP